MAIRPRINKFNNGILFKGVFSPRLDNNLYPSFWLINLDFLFPLLNK